MNERPVRPFGIQSNVWGPEFHAEKFTRMLAEIAAAGYDGIEIGAHRIENLDRPGSFINKVEAQGLQVCGLHTLGKLYFEAARAGDLGYAIRAADFARAVGCRYLLVSGDPGSGSRRRDDRELAAVLNRVGEVCRARGLAYCYHNHWWEIEDDQDELRGLLKQTEPELVSLCLDVGWVARAGSSPLAVCAEFLERIRYIHLKDTLGEAFTELGLGTVDFSGLLDLVRTNADIYLTVERDEVLPNAFESARICREYLSQYER